MRKDKINQEINLLHLKNEFISERRRTAIIGDQYFEKKKLNITGLFRIKSSTITSNYKLFGGINGASKSNNMSWKETVNQIYSECVRKYVFNIIDVVIFTFYLSKSFQRTTLP